MFVWFFFESVLEVFLSEVEFYLSTSSQCLRRVASRCVALRRVGLEPSKVDPDFRFQIAKVAIITFLRKCEWRKTDGINRVAFRLIDVKFSRIRTHPFVKKESKSPFPRPK